MAATYATIRYLVMPGEIVSATDGSSHWVGASTLMRLYGVDPQECVVARADTPTPSYYAGLTQLRPRIDGNYTLEEETSC
jgi:hypothetical protein